ncbi:MAG: hypothetical protein ABSF95_06475 [Verrucomicrobiota bacterium]|jgi:hypothetical protein
MASDPGKTGSETERQRFERILSREAFQGLKAVLDKVSPGQEGLWEGVRAVNSYEELLAKLGYKITLTRQIHVQDSYSRLGQPGGIRAVLPYYDVPTQSSFPTLVNFDGTVTNTPKGAAFFNQMLAELKRQLHG